MVAVHAISTLRSITFLNVIAFLLLGLTFQPNCKFSEHVRLKVIKANKCLHILRTLRKELFRARRKYTDCKYGGPLGWPGTRSVEARLVSPLMLCFDYASF